MLHDPYAYTLALMLRRCLTEIAKLKNPENPGDELAQMREALLHEAANLPTDDAALRRDVLAGVAALMPLERDKARRQ